MDKLTRREVLRIGAGSAAGLAAGQFAPPANQAHAGILDASSAATQVVRGSFLFDQRVIGRLDLQTNRVAESALWGIPAEYEALVPKLLSPLSVGLSELEEWVTTRCSESCPVQETPAAPNLDWSVFATAMNVPVSGLPNLSELVGRAVTTIADGAALDLSLDFLYDSRLEQANQIYLPFVPAGLVAPGATPAIISPPSLTAGADLLAAAPPSVTLLGWRFQFTGPDIHPLGSCLTRNVKHFHVDVFWQNSTGAWVPILTVNLGAYRSGGRRCFVLYKNSRPNVCWRICSPTFTNLREMFQWILIAAAAIAGVTLAAWLISLIASGPASVLWTVLLLLA